MSRNTSASRLQKLRRFSETKKKREDRLNKIKIAASSRRANENFIQRKNRLQRKQLVNQNMQTSQARAKESSAKRSERFAKHVHISQARVRETQHIKRNKKTAR